MESILNKFEAYLLTERRIAINTFNAYMQDIRQFVTFLESNNSILQDTTLDLLKSFLATLKKEQVSARSMSRKISSLKSFFSWAQDTLQWKNYTVDLTFPKLGKKLPNYLLEHEIEELFSVAQQDTTEIGKRNKTMLFLLYVAGLRITELISLTCSRIYFDAGHLEIIGKGGKGRIVPLPQNMVTMIKQYLETYHKTFTQTHGMSDYLFPTLYAGSIKPISRQAFWAILKELCKKTSIKKPVSPHTLRHSLATHLLKKGAHLRSLQMLLGHENISTVQIYTHVDVGYLRKVYDKKHPRS